MNDDGGGEVKMARNETHQNNKGGRGGKMFVNGKILDTHEASQTANS